jgi:hypothetical protein
MMLAVMVMVAAAAIPARAAPKDFPHVAPPYRWHAFLGSAGTDVPVGVSTDKEGNVYLGGYSDASWIGPAGQLPKHGHSGGQDIMIVKLNSQGVYLWHTFLGCSGDDVGRNVAFDAGGNIYIDGYSQANWVGPAGEAARNPFQGAQDLVVVKLDKDGNYQWHTFYGSTSAADWGFGINLDDDGGIYVNGRSDASWNGPLGQLPKHSYDWAQEIVILKLGNNGDYAWHTFYRGYSVAKVVLDDDGNVFVGGYADTAWTGPGGAQPRHAHTGNGLSDMEVIALYVDGSYAWHTFFGSTAREAVYSISVDGDDNIYVSGSSEASWSGPAGQPPKHAFTGVFDLAVLRLDDEGAYQWHTFYYSSGPNFIVSSIRVNDVSNSVILATASDAAWVGPGGQNPMHAYSGDYDMVLLEIDTDGYYRYHTFYGSSGVDYVYSMTVDTLSNIYVAGFSVNSWNGDGGTGPVYQYTGGNDIAIFKLGYYWSYLPGIIRQP